MGHIVILIQNINVIINEVIFIFDKDHFIIAHRYFQIVIEYSVFVKLCKYKKAFFIITIKIIILLAFLVIFVN